MPVWPPAVPLAIGRIYRRFLVDGLDLRTGGPAGAPGGYGDLRDVLGGGAQTA
jgi:hypothetical protein